MLTHPSSRLQWAASSGSLRTARLSGPSSPFLWAENMTHEYHTLGCDDYMVLGFWVIVYVFPYSSSNIWCSFIKKKLTGTMESYRFCLTHLNVLHLRNYWWNLQIWNSDMERRHSIWNLNYLKFKYFHRPAVFDFELNIPTLSSPREGRSTWCELTLVCPVWRLKTRRANHQSVSSLRSRTSLPQASRYSTLHTCTCQHSQSANNSLIDHTCRARKKILQIENMTETKKNFKTWVHEWRWEWRHGFFTPAVCL